MLRQLVVILCVFTGLGCTKSSSIPDNSIQFPIRINLKSLDPAQSSDEATSEVVPNMYEGLLQYAYLKRPLTVEPLLADGMPQVSKDGLTHTFKIKSGVRFHDSEVFPGGKGREVTAEDFVYSWKRVADAKVRSDGFWIFDGKVKGINEWRDKLGKGQATYDTPIEGFETPDPHTLVIKLTRPYFQLYYVLTMSYAAVVPKEAVAKYGSEFMNHPVGTGPYMFESWIRGNKVVLTRNPTWHGGTYPTEGEAADKDNGLLADAGKPMPFADKIILHEIPEDQPRWLNLMKGTMDFAGIPKDNYDAAVEKGELKPALTAKGLKLQIYPYPDVVYMSFNMQDPILGKNVNLRRALSLAYDTKTSLEKFYNNRGVIAQSPITVDMEGYDPEFKNPWKQYDIEKAKELMKKAGYPGGKGLPPLEYSLSGSTTGRQMAEYLTQQWEKIGVKLTITANSWPQFNDRIKNKKAQLFGIAWGADYPDAENMFQLLYGPNISPGPNNANYQNKEFDALYEKALKLPSGAERTAIYKKMRDIFVEDMPWIPTIHRQGQLLQHGWLKNLKRHETIHGIYKYLRVDLDKKKELKPKL
jgi:oligopeptide transport system substrate-binding protein